MTTKKQGKNPDFSRPATFSAFGAALRKVRETRGLTLDVLAAKTAISKPYLSNIETARAPGPPSEEKLRKIALALELPVRDVIAAADWLRTPESVRKVVLGQSAPRRADGTIDLDAVMGPPASVSRQDTKRNESDEIPVRGIPVINRVAAGKAGEYGDLDYPAGAADAYVPAPDLPEAPVAAAFAVRISGDSMMPEYAEGEIVIVGPGDAQDGDDCVVRLGEGENFATTFKRVFFVRDREGDVTGVRLVALNPKYTERRVRVEEVSGVYPLMYRMVPAKRAEISPAVEKGERVSGSFTTALSIEHD